MIVESFSEKGTYELGLTLGQKAKAGEVYCLLGDLGVGKTVFTKGFAKGLGIEEPISSPTFTILQVYDEGRIPLYHFDWYRLESADELYEMGMDEQLGGDGVALIEWSRKAAACLPQRVLEVCIRATGENERKLLFAPRGGFVFEEDWLK